MAFYIVDIILTEEGYESVFPGLLLAAPTSTSSYGLYECKNVGECEDEELVLPPGVRKLPDSTAKLLYSAKDYTPAMALMRDEVSSREHKAVRIGIPSEEIPVPSVEEFLQDVETSLIKHLQAQRSSGYFLARATGEENGYLTPGGYYWVLGYTRSWLPGRVHWVSRDYFVYQNAITDFELTRKDLEERFGPAPAEWDQS